MIERHKVDRFGVSFLRIPGKQGRIVFADVAIFCEKEIHEIEYIDTKIALEYGEIVKIILCPTDLGTIICNVVVELNSQSQPTPEEIYRDILSALNRVGCTP
ncbi:hypothetical protein GWK48_02010 [Metallosphaera tengchongensis]|uniref:Uncharacterized protein n=1 Tax=Metallosphaera tengchongensis TaxID=1532350 RepID=A0A6N0NW00_9CREN|nr:hypothetical protein [Metallosphaera tengchongensis]QKQ99329.1 hypothetical protein GWK48_02010 [Metallosphaera tengchongensis]